MKIFLSSLARFVMNNKSNSEPPSKLLNRLKIVHSFQEKERISEVSKQVRSPSLPTQKPIKSKNLQFNNNGINENNNTLKKNVIKSEETSQIIIDRKSNMSAMSTQHQDSNKPNFVSHNRLISKPIDQSKLSIARPFSTQARYLTNTSNNHLQSIRPMSKKPPRKDLISTNNNNNKDGTTGAAMTTTTTTTTILSSQLSTCNSSELPLQYLRDISDQIRCGKIKNIVVLAGAGISCPSGIPDFRSPGSGLYDNLQQYKIPYPEAIFDIDYFYQNPKPFFILAKELYPSGVYRPNKAHYFLRMLQDKKLLLRVYTQNIDGLERLAGVTDNNLVEAHGTFASASCLKCSEIYSGTFVKMSIDKDEISYCTKCRGIVKPNIVFFGENLPGKFQLYNRDLRQADLVFVMGTSLEVEPFASIVDTARLSAPRILINRDAVGIFKAKRRVHDHTLLGDIIDGVDTIAQYMNWTEDLQNTIKMGEMKKIEFQDTIASISKPIITNPRRNMNTSNGYRSVSNNNILPPINSTNQNFRRYHHNNNINNNSRAGRKAVSTPSTSSSSISSSSSEFCSLTSSSS